MSRAPWESAAFQEAWREAGKLTPVLDTPEERTGYETPVRDAILGWLALLACILSPFLLVWLL